MKEEGKSPEGAVRAQEPARGPAEDGDPEVTPQAVAVGRQRRSFKGN